MPAAKRNMCVFPFADVGPIKIYEDLRDEQVLFLSDIFPNIAVMAQALAPEVVAGLSAIAERLLLPTGPDERRAA